MIDFIVSGKLEIFMFTDNKLQFVFSNIRFSKYYL